jgi:hypothetical protein
MVLIVSLQDVANLCDGFSYWAFTLPQFFMAQVLPTIVAHSRDYTFDLLNKIIITLKSAKPHQALWKRKAKSQPQKGRGYESCFI